ncbi:hypothetical protein [Streptomyces mangrovisoli]|uniref:Uncharacterized protein n=1 Tax=Streptomyces mangrovisoli TaxID=1428628 RepID=A0A1J4P1A5_9ACTN|nr:hypothetical protein [Streptomyces mangrovisoli]OIJ67230.1 hypothetical protein WN71_014615 [Streptomyces mangrovisoli]
MTFAVGLFELFGVAIPGGVQLAVLLYVLDRLHLVDVGALAAEPSALPVIGAVVGSYVLGSVTTPLSAAVDKILPRRLPAPEDARRVFLACVPEARDRPYVAVEPTVLLAAAELHDKPVAAEVTRMEAVGMMQRSLAFSLALASVVAAVQCAAGPGRPVAACAAVLLSAAAVGTAWRERATRYYPWLKTLEICFWIPDIDAPFARDDR